MHFEQVIVLPSRKPTSIAKTMSRVHIKQFGNDVALLTCFAYRVSFCMTFYGLEP
jgi:hypothetical protein